LGFPVASSDPAVVAVAFPLLAFRAASMRLAAVVLMLQWNPERGRPISVGVTGLGSGAIVRPVEVLSTDS